MVKLDKHSKKAAEQLTGKSLAEHVSRTSRTLDSPINQMIDAACGSGEIQHSDKFGLKLTDEQKELCVRLGTEVIGDLSFYYPDVVKTRPTTWPLHLRNTIANKVETLLIKILESD